MRVAGRSTPSPPSRLIDVLIQYLSVEHARVDPVERLGDDAVINYAAWSLARTREERVFALLLRLAQRPSLSSVIGKLQHLRPERGDTSLGKCP